VIPEELLRDPEELARRARRAYREIDRMLEAELGPGYAAILKAHRGTDPAGPRPDALGARGGAAVSGCWAADAPGTPGVDGPYD
jgi:hypothetical protein